MTAIMRDRKSEKGAALIVVLLLIATLSFILLSITNVVTAAVKRSAADRARTDFYWRAAAGELIAQQILEKYLATNPVKMAPGEGIFAKPIEVPIEGGTAKIAFQDATVCFNINSLVTSGPGGTYTANTPATQANDGFTIMLEALGLGSGEAAKLMDVIVDFIDSDSFPQGQGVEDGFYSALPTPYRTGGQLIKSVSELRAMDGVSGAYGLLRDNLCPLDSTNLEKVNVNWARWPDSSKKQKSPTAILLAYFPATAGMSADKLSSLLQAIPPGGFPSAAAIDPALMPAVTGFEVRSDRIEAIITLEVNDLTIEEKVLFDTAGGAPKFLARTFGDDY